MLVYIKKFSGLLIQCDTNAILKSIIKKSRRKENRITQLYITALMLFQENKPSWIRKGSALFPYCWLCNRKISQFLLKAILLLDLNSLGMVLPECILASGRTK